MGYMVDGVYHIGDDVTQTLPSGEWERSRSTVRNWLGQDGFDPEPGRYHLYAAWNCPWAHRVLLARALLGLEDAISVAYARPNRTEMGWVYDNDGPYADPLMGVANLPEVYAADPIGYTGRLTVPVLWDRTQARMVSNESADILRMLAAFGRGADLYPTDLAQKIDDWNALIYARVNNGVYRAGFASTQNAYAAAATEVFDTLDQIEAHLATHRWLCGDHFTEADLRLFPTLARFDVAYHYAFRCNLRRLMDYPRLWAYAREIYQMPGVAETVRFDIYKKGYFSASEKRNPLGIIPIGPAINWDVPHGRD